MKFPRDVGYTEKIFNCIDDLLMEDSTFSRQNLKSKIQKTNQQTHRDQIQKSVVKQPSVKKRKPQQKQQQRRQRRQKLSSSKPKQSLTSQQFKPLNIKNDPNKKKSIKQILPTITVTKEISSSHKNVSFQNQDKFLKMKNRQNSQKQGNNSYSNAQLGASMLKKTFSYELKGYRESEKRVQDQKQSDGIKMEVDDQPYIDQQLQHEHASNEHSPKALLSMPTRSNLKLQSTLKLKKDPFNNLKRPNYPQQSPPKNQPKKNICQHEQSPSTIVQNSAPITVSSIESQQFYLSHEQLQFLSLLYPNQSPKELMLKLLSYYEQQQQYKNSFQQLLQKDLTQYKNQFFRTRPKIQINIPDSIIELEDSFQGDENKQNSVFVKYKPTLSNTNQGETDFSRLKEECLAALGQQMVEIQIKSSIAETAHVNYYTRQYAMPIIMQILKQKNDQAQQKLQKLDSIRRAQKYNYTHNMQQFTMRLNHPYTTQDLYSSSVSYSKMPQDFMHKVYIPANSRGQCFDMDYKPDSKLFEYMTQGEYRRILRDINHLIQKVLSYHRHSSFLKKKNNSLFKGWNLALFGFLLIVLLMLYIRCYIVLNSSDLDIIVFFCLSFIVILLLGNSFNNYKKSVKRSSVIKDICEEISNYLQFINCSSKNIKWVLGKDFFWLEVWINVLKSTSSK